MLTPDFIQAAASRAGFDACGVAALDELPEDLLRRFCEWLQHGYHAGMRYMERHLQKRADPRLLLKSGARTAVVTLFSYKPQRPQPPHLPQVSCYAYGRDYHGVIKQKLWGLLAALQAEHPALRGRAFVDTAPLQERYLAVKAGLGWVGKNGMLISKELGSYTFVGTLLLSDAVGSDAQEQKSRCGACTRCLSACPTGAIRDNGVVNSQLCLSYATIEKYANPLQGEDAGAAGRAGMAKDEKTAAAGYIFGCDICQDACPWNKKAKVAAHSEMQLLPQLLTLTADDWLEMSDDDFEKIFEQSPIRRATLQGMKENVRAIQQPNSK
ncbi:MAG: tRNA epoxyqueuosine(34) reductase QueG [Prevotellaceae bacterium]|nr:tRNA epoxyqueuosine(34) reductase QueG [Prevotellaceae bacterium]